MDRLLQQTLDGLASGALYGALALAIVLVFRSSRLVNFAQGEMAMVATYVAWQFQAWGLGVWMSVLVAMVAAFAFGALIERVLVRPLVDTSHLTVVIVTLGLLLVLNSGAGWVWGHLTKEFPPMFGDGVVSVAGASMSWQSLGIMGTVVVVAGLLFVLFQRTTLGLTMRAASSNAESARLAGIPVGRMLGLSWGLAAAVGALVGALVAPQLFLSPNLMASLLLYAFAAATLGGFDSPVGALVGGVIVGLVENLAGTYVSWIGADFKQALALVIILVVLLVRPQGLFGTVQVTRV